MTNTSHSLTVETLDRAAAINKLPGELDDLATRALEPNLFHEALVLIPALQHIDTDVPLTIACVRDRSGVLLGVVPLVVEPLRPGFPAKVLRNWMHRYCFLGTPLIDARAAPAVLQALAAWIERGDAPAGGLQWSRVSWDGPFGKLVRQIFGTSATWAMDVSTTQRAILNRAHALQPAISGKHAKELRRLERRLSVHGHVQYSVMQHSEDWQAWYDEFLSVEASGWKGAAGSAIASRGADQTFFRELVQRAHAAERLQFLRLAVAGRAVAMKLNVRACAQSYALKIGHDESYARYSPGVLLELFNIKQFQHESADIAFMDSCAHADHAMINRLWPGRRDIATVTLVRHGLLLRALVKLRPAARRLRLTTLAPLYRLEKQR